MREKPHRRDSGGAARGPPRPRAVLRMSGVLAPCVSVMAAAEAGSESRSSTSRPSSHPRGRPPIRVTAGATRLVHAIPLPASHRRRRKSLCGSCGEGRVARLGLVRHSAACRRRAHAEGDTSRTSARNSHEVRDQVDEEADPVGRWAPDGSPAAPGGWGRSGAPPRRRRAGSPPRSDTPAAAAPMCEGERLRRRFRQSGP